MNLHVKKITSPGPQNGWLATRAKKLFFLERESMKLHVKKITPPGPQNGRLAARAKTRIC